MSIEAATISYQSTANNFDVNLNLLGSITDLIITTDDWTATESQLNDIDYLRSEMAAGNIFALHDVFETDKQNKEPEYKDSVQDYSYRNYPGKKIHQYRFNWRLDYAQIVDQFSGQTNLRVIYGIKNESFLCKNVSGTLSGFKISSIYLDSHDLDEGIMPLRVELQDIEEVKQYGYLLQSDFSVSDIDRVYVTISVDATTTTMTLQITTVDGVVESLTVTDISVIDNVNGELEYSVFSETTGVYTLGGFSANLTQGCVIVLSELYLGKQTYFAEAVIIYDNWTLMSTDNFVTMGGDNFIFVNTN